MGKKQSAGTLLYRVAAAKQPERPDGLVEVLLVHPSGAYNRKAPWSIPKGLVDGEEDLEMTARRETFEETGVTPGKLVSLGWIDYRKSHKRIHAFTGPIPEQATPRCASWEVDRVDMISIEQARSLLHPDQQPFLDRMLDVVGNFSLPKPIS